MRRIERTFWLAAGAAALGAVAWLGVAGAEEPAPVEEPDDGALMELSLEDLMEVEVTSVSKRAQKLAETPAAVYVIDQEQIRRSGMQTIPDLLRMVPGLHVASIDANQWAVTARGFNNQFANKLLVLVDGRSVYNPIFSGVFWDEQDLVLDDIDRIEVIRGPGGTVWGANAVNGVINIITKEAKDSQGLLVTSTAGSLEKFGGAGRWGGAVGDDFHYRAYVKGFDRRGYDSPFAGQDTAHDAWYQVRGGLRSDWNLTGSDVLSFDGQYYSGESEEMPGILPNDEYDLSGGHFLARWSHAFSEDSDTALQAYYDHEQRQDGLTADYRIQTVDLDFQHRYAAIPRNEIVWGANYRHYGIHHGAPTIPIILLPSSEEIDLGGGFVQDEVTLVPSLLKVTVGSKFDTNTYSGFEYQPSGRILLTPGENHTVWAAVSRAVRMPTQGESSTTVTIPVPLLVVSGGSPDSEKVLAYELGYRAKPLPNVSFDLAGYYNVYNDLATVDITGPNSAVFGNAMDGRGWGTEVALDWRATSFLRLRGAYTYMKVDTDMPITSINPNEPANPKHQFNIRSFVDLPWHLSLDSTVFWVGAIPSLTYYDGSLLQTKTVGSYVRFDTRLAWQPRPGVELSLVGQNLTSAKHAEYGNQFLEVATLVPRSVFGKVTWNY